mmetsp:Transcript_4551/g.10715  ORF Transcript_4551/g.10715 Transcript_4551/m.10715 type:complete len:225 (+) Transcript_4551:413-1087(+)
MDRARSARTRPSSPPWPASRGTCGVARVMSSPERPGVLSPRETSRGSAGLLSCATACRGRAPVGEPVRALPGSAPERISVFESLFSASVELPDADRPDKPLQTLAVFAPRDRRCGRAVDVHGQVEDVGKRSGAGLLPRRPDEREHARVHRREPSLREQRARVSPQPEGEGLAEGSPPTCGPGTRVSRGWSRAARPKKEITSPTSRPCFSTVARASAQPLSSRAH